MHPPPPTKSGADGRSSHALDPAVRPSAGKEKGGKGGKGGGRSSRHDWQGRRCRSTPSRRRMPGSSALIGRTRNWVVGSAFVLTANYRSFVLTGANCASHTHTHTLAPTVRWAGFSCWGRETPIDPSHPMPGHRHAPSAFSFLFCAHTVAAWNSPSFGAPSPCALRRVGGGGGCGGGWTDSRRTPVQTRLRPDQTQTRPKQGGRRPSTILACPP